MAVVAAVANGQGKARPDGFDGYLLQVVLSAHASTPGQARQEIRRRHACLSECSANLGARINLRAEFLARVPQELVCTSCLGLIAVIRTEPIPLPCTRKAPD